MEIIYLPKAGDDLDFWTGTGNKAILKRIDLLTGAIIQGPYQGIGKPEALNTSLPVNGRAGLPVNTATSIRLTAIR